MAKDLTYHDPDKLIIIGLDTEDREGSHPLYDPRAHYEVPDRVVKNIMLYGIQEPVICRREAGKLIVIDGRQRVKAAREAKRQQAEAGAHEVKVPVLESVGDDKRAFGIMIALNEIRENDDALDKAFKAARMQDMGADDDELSLTFGRSKTTIREWLGLAACAPEVHAAFKAGKVSASAMNELAKLHREEQVDSLKTLIKTAEVQDAEAPRVTVAAATKRRQKVTGAITSDANRALARSTEVPGEDGTVRPDAAGKKRAKHQGVKRGWLRRALKTKVAREMTEQDMQTFRWFAYGEAKEGTFIYNFMIAAEAELSKKRARKAKVGKVEKDGGSAAVGKKKKPAADGASATTPPAAEAAVPDAPAETLPAEA